MPTNTIYGWGVIPSEDTGIFQKPDGTFISLSALNAMENDPPAPEVQALFSNRENERDQEFQRLRVDYNVDISQGVQNHEPRSSSGQNPNLSSSPDRNPSLNPNLSPVSRKVPSSVDELWEEIASAQDHLRKLFLALAGQKVPGTGKWLMENVSYINTSQIEGIGIRMGLNPE